MSSDIKSINRSILQGDLLKALLDNMPDHIYFKDLDSRFIMINKSQAKLLGLNDPAEAAGKTDFDFFSAEHASQAYADEQNIIRSGKPIQAKEEKETWPDKAETWALTTKSPLFNDKNEVVGTFGISSDITKLKHAQAAMKKADEQRVMIEAIGTALHHLGQPQTVLLTNLGMMKRFCKSDNNQCHELIDECIKAVDRMSDILRRLSEASEYKTEPYIGRRSPEDNDDQRLIEI